MYVIKTLIKAKETSAALKNGEGLPHRAQQSVRKTVSFYLLLTSIVCKDLTERAEPPDSLQEKEKQTTQLVN